jgi:hypothetical protein
MNTDSMAKINRILKILTLVAAIVMALYLGSAIKMIFSGNH